MITVVIRRCLNTCFGWCNSYFYLKSFFWLILMFCFYIRNIFYSTERNCKFSSCHSFFFYEKRGTLIIEPLRITYVTMIVICSLLQNYAKVIINGRKWKTRFFLLFFLVALKVFILEVSWTEKNVSQLNVL